MFEMKRELLSGERQVAPTIDGIRPDHVARYRWAAQYLHETGQAHRVLDLGCGVGYGAHILATEADCSVVAVDASAQAIEYAMEHYADDRIIWGVRDLTKPLVDRFFADPYQAVIAFEIIEHLENPIPLLKMALRLIGDHGCLLVSVPNEEGFPFESVAHPQGPKFHYRHYTRSELVDLLVEAGVTRDDASNIGFQKDQHSTRIQPGADPKSRTLVGYVHRGKRGVAETTMLDFERIAGEKIIANRWPKRIPEWSGFPDPEGSDSPLVARADGRLTFAVANGSATYEEVLGLGAVLIKSEWTQPDLPRGGAIVDQLNPTFGVTAEGLALYASQPWPQRIQVPWSFFDALPIVKQGAEAASLSSDGETIRFRWQNGDASYRVLQWIGDKGSAIMTRLPGAAYEPAPADVLGEDVTFETLATTYGTFRLQPRPAPAKVWSPPPPIEAPDAQWAAPETPVAGHQFASDPAKGKHVVILGMGPSLEGYVDLVKRLGARRVFADEVWAINGVADVVQCDRVFHMDDVAVQEIRAAAQPNGNIAPMLGWLRTHAGPIYTSVPRDGYPGLVAYPLADVINATGHIYFNSTVAYAVAMAVAVGASKISLFGIDFTYPSAHKAEKGRACVEFWLAIALERNIEVGIGEKSTIFDTIEGGVRNLYGFDAMDVTIEQQRDTTVAVKMTPKPVLPTAEEIEAAYDHGVHPNALMRTPKR